jgi:hypothetical protein
MGHNDDEESFLDALGQIPERFIVAEEELDRTVYEEYSEFVQHLASCRQDESVLDPSRALFDPAKSLELKRGMLARLAQLGTVGAYRIIDRYARHPDPSLAQWSKIALHECRMALESDLLEENVGIISTGLGGVEHRLRYIAVVGFSCMPLHETQQAGLEKAWRATCEQHDSLLERIQFHPRYVMATVLVSMETAVGTVIEDSIAAANGDGKVLQHDYFVTNVNIPTDEEIQRILKEIYPGDTSE